MSRIAKTMTIEVHRGPLLENSHLVHVAVTDAGGSLVRSWGDPDRLTHPRSSIKAWQALPLLESGAASAFDVSVIELALACASHNGEPAHVAGVEAWLARIGCSVDDLECGVQDGHATAAWNNCSGKHAGFLTVARHLGVSTAGYIDPNHPVQRLVDEACSAATGFPVDREQAGIDGCGIPVYPVPLHAIATAGARLGSPPNTWPQRRRDAVAALVDAMVAEPWFIAGTGGLCTELLSAGRGEVLVKVGAEGVQMAALPARGLGIAIKAQSGNRLASEVALGYTLDALAPDLKHRWADVFERRRTITNHVGRAVGQLRVTAD